MQSDTLEAISRSAAIPSMPLVATRCYEMSQDPLCSYDKIVELLSTDPGIAAEILRIANSAMFGLVRQVDSLKQAIALLGLTRVRDLVLMRYMVQSLNTAKTDPIDLSYFWRRCTGGAIVAGKLAATKAPRRRDEAFIAGLLADVGVVILTQALPSKYKPIAAQYRPLGGDAWKGQEREVLGVSHGQVSAMVLEAWSLPGAIVESVRHHHDPIDAIPTDSPARDIAPLIGAAQTIAGAISEASDPARAAAHCVEAMEGIKLSPAVLVDALPSIESDIENLATALKVDVIPSKTFKLIADQIAKQITVPVD
jgi:HD-like signal output (HDOD) protein